jgi:PAS domain S-box-containing protein
LAVLVIGVSVTIGVYRVVGDAQWQWSVFGAGSLCMLLLAVCVHAILVRRAEVRWSIETSTRELMESERRARSIIESVQTGILVVDSQTHEILDVNAVAASMIGRPVDEIRGHVCHQFICPAECGDCPILDLGQTEDKSERVLLTADGARLPILKSAVPIELFGRPCLLESFLDISQRKRVEDELAHSERRLSLQNQVGQVFLTASDEELYVRVLALVCGALQSELGAFGYIDEDGSLVVPTLQGEVWDRCEMSDKRLRFPHGAWGESLWGRAITEQQSFCRNHPSTVPCGHVAVNRCLIVPIVDHEQTVGLLIMANKTTDYGDEDHELLKAVAGYLAPALNARLQRDIHERKRRQAEEQLKEYAEALRSANQTLKEYYHVADSATRAKSEFLANMSHEIRTPMTSILGYADLLLNSRFTEEEQQLHLQTIRHNGEILLKLINDILDLSKIEANRIVIEHVECSPMQIVEDVLSLFNVRAIEKGVFLTAGYDFPLPSKIQTDPLRLRQILVNLVGNAVKFTEQGQVQIHVRCVPSSQGSPCIEWIVRDTGIGVAQKDLPYLFQPFSQVDASAKRRCGGTGLGLVISKRLAELLGGTIRVESDLGRGSTFTLSIDPGSLAGVPMIESLADRPAESSANSSDSSSAICGRILLAEDGPDNQRLIRLVLLKAGLEVELAENGRVAFDKAMASLNDRPFDLILMDIQMPQCDGYEATRMLRQAGWNRPIVALTAHAMVGDREECLKAGCDGYTTKPIDRKVLLATIAQFLAKDARAEPSSQPAKTET